MPARPKYGPPILFGASGMLGSRIAALLPQGAMCPTRRECDASQKSSYMAFIEDIIRSGTRPSAIINCAAFTNVDACELDAQPSEEINVRFPLALSRAFLRGGSCPAPVLMFSTDFVFGAAEREKPPFTEESPTAPLMAYGRQKAQMERAALEHGHLVVRTARLFDAEQRLGFPSWACARLSAGQQVPAITDEKGNFTSAKDLAKKSVELLKSGTTGLWHCAGARAATPFELACELAEKAGNWPRSLVRPILASSLGRAAARPADSSLASVRGPGAMLGAFAANNFAQEWEGRGKTNKTDMYLLKNITKKTQE